MGGDGGAIIEGVTRSSKIYFLGLAFDAASPGKALTAKTARPIIAPVTVRAAGKLAMITPLHPGSVGQP